MTRVNKSKDGIIGPEPIAPVVIVDPKPIGEVMVIKPQKKKKNSKPTKKARKTKKRG